MPYCTKCGDSLREEARFCTHCGAARTEAAPVRVAPPPPMPGPAPASATPAGTGADGHAHHPAWALAAGVLLPGAGQAYNGQPRKAFYLLLGSVLVLPYLYSLYDAYHVAGQIAAEGGRRGPGGLFWVAVQGWRFLNLILLILIGLTMAGVLS